MRNICGWTKQDLKTIREFVKSINNEITLRISPVGEWHCRLMEYKLFLGNKKKPIQEDIIWNKWYREQEFYIGEVNTRVISLLHEIGHYQTFNVEEWELRNKQVNEYIDQYYDYKIELEELNFKYWNTTNEYKATQWAIEYYKTHKAQCEKLAKQLKL